MGKYFGTDGFRGEAGVDLSALHAFEIGRFLGRYLIENKIKDNRKPRIAIGKDTRLSSYMLEYAIASGLSSSGADVYLAHVITTPGLIYLTLKEQFDLGIMITASHNPFSDNGIKIITSSGEKMDDTLTSLIEEYIDSDKAQYSLPSAKGGDIGIIYSYPYGRDEYTEHLISTVNSSFKGLRIGLDSANGSAYDISRKVFESLGAEVYSIGNTPNGTNINRLCGSTHIDNLISLVKEKELDVGFAFDGDADRCIAVDKSGRVIDGDGIIYVLAKRFLRQGLMQNPPVVVTVMSNGGLIKSLTNLGIKTEITSVGDRFVLERMQEKDAMLGGEQSGHIIMRNYSGAGDGILTALILTTEMIEQNSSLEELTQDLVLYPQESKSVYVKNKSLAMKDDNLRALIERVRSELSPDERLLVRESGTEPKLRIMIEAEQDSVCKTAVNKIISLLEKKGYIDDK